MRWRKKTQSDNPKNTDKRRQLVSIWLESCSDALPREEEVCVRGRWWPHQGNLLVRVKASLPGKICKPIYNFLSGDGRTRGEINGLSQVKKFIWRAQPMLTSEELFAKVNPPPKSSFSLNAHSALWNIYIQMDLFSIPRVTMITWQLLVLRPSLMTLWKISQNVYMFFLIDFVPSSLLLLQNWNKMWSDQIDSNSEHLLQARCLVYTGDCSQNLERIPKLNWIKTYTWMELWE